MAIAGTTPTGRRRAAVTGLGVIAPGGNGRKAFWERITSGVSAIRGITLFDPTGLRSRIAGECDFNPAEYGLTPRDIRRMDRCVQLGTVAAREALEDSGLETGACDPARIGVSMGTAVGPATRMESEYVVLSDRGKLWVVDHTYVMPYAYESLVPSTLAAETARLAGAEGPVGLVSNGCTTGLDALGHAAALIEEGSADIVIAGSSEAPITPTAVAAFDVIRATSPNNDDPAHASRPFDRNRDGFVLAEGAAVLIVEELGHALRRGAHIYCEIAGYAGRSNAHHMAALKDDGLDLAEAIRCALERARVAPGDVDYINAHGSSTPQNDRHETAAFKAALGEHARRTPISSIKSVVGHPLGAIGAMEIAACALAIEHGVLPPTANLRTPDPDCDLDYVPLTAREQRTDVALTTASGFGGFQCAMVLTRSGAGAA
jgi:act minimal PKS ketosynthase (KS/KS alpha)